MKKLSKGILVAVEGIDGSGKSTLVRNLVHQLTHEGYPVMATREPGATGLGSIIRSIVQKKEIPRSAKAEFLLFAADRAQHFHEIVLPALEQGMIVISDRMADSSLVYQGYGRGLDRSMLAMINTWAMEDRLPDLVLYVKIDEETAIKRIHARTQELTAFEQEHRSFTHKLIKGFDDLFINNARAHTLDGRLAPATLCSQAYQGLCSWINANNLSIQ